MVTVRSFETSFMSIKFFSNAKRLTDLAKSFELENSESKYLNLDEYNENVLNVIILSVTFLESLINEFFYIVSLDNKHNSDFYKLKLSKEQKRILAELWCIDKIQRLSILEKYELVLTTAGKNKFDKGHDSYQDINLLILFRNSLIHYHPDRAEVNYSKIDETLEQTKFEKKLYKKLYISPLIKPSKNYFPYKYLSYNTAEWCLKIVSRFVTDFYHHLDTEYYNEGILIK